jgi:hypothetical protein
VSTEEKIGKWAAIGSLVFSVYDRFKAWKAERKLKAKVAKAKKTADDLKRISDMANRGRWKK